MTGNGTFFSSRKDSTSRSLFPAPIPMNLILSFNWGSCNTMEKTWFITGAWSWQEKQYLFRNSTTIRSALTSLREKWSPLTRPKNFWGSPRYSVSDRVRVMGKEYSGKKAPGVTTRPFSLAHGPEHNKIPKAMTHPPTKITLNLFIQP